MGIKVIAPLATLSTGDHLTIYQKIPIEKCAQLNWHSSTSPKSATLSFYVYTNKIGNYTGVIAMPSHLVNATSLLINTSSPTGGYTTNSAGALSGLSGVLSRLCRTFTFNVPTADTWTKIEVTATSPALISIGATTPTVLLSKNQPLGLGLTVGITLAASGTDTVPDGTSATGIGNVLNRVTASINNWGVYSNTVGGAPALAPVGTTQGVTLNNILDTAGNYFYFTCAQLEAASASTTYGTIPPAYMMQEWVSQYEIPNTYAVGVTTASTQRIGGMISWKPKREYGFHLSQTSTSVGALGLGSSVTGVSSILNFQSNTGFVYCTGAAAGELSFSASTLLRYHPHDYVSHMNLVYFTQTNPWIPRLS
jgi:hypothetical protein